MPNFWNVVKKVIDQADVLLLVLDARLVSQTRNVEVENKVRAAKKPLIFVITKADLVKGKYIAKKDLWPYVLVSAKEHLGTAKLREKILIEAKKAYGDQKSYQIGVLGYPNVGKSSLINAMKGKKSASTSSMSGHTKGVQNVRADNRIMFLDSPGVIPYKEKDESKHGMIGSVDYNKVKDPDLVVMDLMQEHPGKVEKYFGISSSDDLEEVLEEIAVKKNFLQKGNAPDVMRTARMILKEWQEGKIT